MVSLMLRLSNLLITLITALIVCAGPISPPDSANAASEAEQDRAIGVDERLGLKIPLDLSFRDETGASVRLADLVTVPTVIMPVYYSCSNVCLFQQARMASTLQVLNRRPNLDYRIISVSFDENETPQMAARSKLTYLTAIKAPFPQEGWRFLTGDAATIRRLTDAIGYRFQRSGKEFLHPVASVVVSADGTIIRYLYGVSVLPKNLSLAITEAREGRSGSAIRTVMEYCFTYDPQQNGYVFNLLRVSATVVILSAGCFLAFLLLTGKKKPRSSSKKR